MPGWGLAVAWARSSVVAEGLRMAAPLHAVPWPVLRRGAQAARSCESFEAAVLGGQMHPLVDVVFEDRVTAWQQEAFSEKVKGLSGWTAQTRAAVSAAVASLRHRSS